MSPVGFFCPFAFKDSTDGQYLWGRGSISSEAILVFSKDVISTLDATHLELVDKFTYLGSSVSSTEKTSKRG